MTAPQLTPPLPGADETVLLVLLPAAAAAQPLPQRLAGDLEQLQQQLGPAIRVLKIEEAKHPTVVRSFHAAALPACVLVRRGIELWRQPGLPSAETAAALLGKLAEPVGVSAA